MIRTLAKPHCRAAVALAALVQPPNRPAHATNIERVTSPGGIEAWLVRDTVAAADCAELLVPRRRQRGPRGQGRHGLHGLVDARRRRGRRSTSRAFHQQLEENAVELRFSATHDYFQGSIKLLSERQDKSFELLRLALERAAVRGRGHRPRARADHGGAPPRDHRSGLDRRPHLVERGLRRPSLCAGRTTARSTSVPTITEDDLKAYAQARVHPRAT